MKMQRAIIGHTLHIGILDLRCHSKINIDHWWIICVPYFILRSTPDHHFNNFSIVFIGYKLTQTIKYHILNKCNILQPPWCDYYYNRYFILPIFENFLIDRYDLSVVNIFLFLSYNFFSFWIKCMLLEKNIYIKQKSG